ncbi:hypothetical protein DRJ16_07705 [Candidatus Woesearchaeota archaeon]|nr:MAG: hypothetical protein DRJ16_07705 [Candidatus Woesearchaeota archaeon]
MKYAPPQGWFGLRKPTPPYSALVAKDGSTVWAEDASGKTIASGKSGVDDVSVINQAISYVYNNGLGGTVKLVGIFIIDSSITVLNRVQVEGLGTGTWLIRKENTDTPIFEFSKSVTGVTYPAIHMAVRHLCIHGKKNEGGTGYAFKLGDETTGDKNRNFISVEDILVKHCDFLYVYKSYWSTFRKVTVLYPPNRAILGFGNLQTFEDCVFKSEGDETGEKVGTGVEIAGESWYFKSCDFSRWDVAVKGRSIEGDLAKLVTFDSCWWELNNIAIDTTYMWGCTVINPTWELGGDVIGTNPYHLIAGGEPNGGVLSVQHRYTKIPLFGLKDILSRIAISEFNGAKLEAVAGNIVVSDDGQIVSITGGSTTEAGDSRMYWQLPKASDEVIIKTRVKIDTASYCAIWLRNTSPYYPSYNLRIHPTSGFVLHAVDSEGNSYWLYTEEASLNTDTWYDVKIYWRYGKFLAWRDEELIVNIDDTKVSEVLQIDLHVQDDSTTEALTGHFAKPFVVLT